MSEEQQEFKRISISQTAMRLGLWLGLYQSVKLAMVPLATKSALAGIVFGLLAISVPFVAYRLIRKFRDDNTADFFPFISSWLITILMFLFATMISSVVAYLYMRYADNGSIQTFLIARMEESRAVFAGTDEAAGTNEMLAMADQTIDLFKAMNPLTTAKMLVSNSMFFGNIFSVVIALATARIKRLKIE